MTSIRDKKEKLPPCYRKGKFKPFISTEISPFISNKSAINKIDHFFIFTLLSLGVLIRLYRIPLPRQVVFDEVHFGGFSKEYFLGEFFLDVHPPLAKLIFYWIAVFFGWNGGFEFQNIGDYFDNNVPYVAMRLFPGICGILTVVITYGILRASCCRPIVAFFGSFLVLVENSLVTQSRLILLDSPLLFGVALTVLGFKKMQLETPFTKRWYKYSILTGLGLGITTSIKLTGLFTVAWVGILTLLQLWKYLGDLTVSGKSLLGHFFSRIFAFIVLPSTIYLGIFAVHFVVLPLNGSGSGAMTANFRSSFHDSDDLKNMPVDVSFGSTVTIKHYNLESYLHSHDLNYLTGSGEQQVTLCGYTPDENNEWIIEVKNKNLLGQLQKSVRKLADGDTVRLYHKKTGKYLHVNDVRPPISEHDYCNEVSCAGDRDTLGDINYEFKIRIALRRIKNASNLGLIKVRATETVFQLIHQGTKCILMSHEARLPEWGSKQNEVLCVDEPTVLNSLWYIEYNSHPLLDADTETYPRVDLKPLSFWGKVVELHQAMFRANKSFTDDHPYSSSPETWPFLLRGINYFTNDGNSKKKLTDEDGSHIYFLGNVPIYYIGFFLVTLIIARQIIYALWHLNPFSLPIESTEISVYFQNTFEFVLGWALNYFPFFFMARKLFLHHYLSSLYFSILLMAQYAEFQISKRRFFGYIYMIIVSSLAVFFFLKFFPIIYGTNWTFESCDECKWFPMWDINCMIYNT